MMKPQAGREWYERREDLPVWRLIRETPGDPVRNMAVDEALLLAPADGRGSPTLRLYGWVPPAVSLGRFEPSLPLNARNFCRSAGIQVVRRPTGGGRVLHDAEVTYSLTAPLGSFPFPRSVIRIYQKIADALQQGLAVMGLDCEARERDRSSWRGDFTEPCFSRVGRWEICWRGRKILGSAQARVGNRFLQHGSLPIRLDRAMLLRAAGGTPGSAETMPAVSLEEALGRRPSAEEISEALVRGFERSFGIRFQAGSLSLPERELVNRIIGRRTAPAPAAGSSQLSLS